MGREVVRCIQRRRDADAVRKRDGVGVRSSRLKGVVVEYHRIVDYSVFAGGHEVGSCQSSKGEPREVVGLLVVEREMNSSIRSSSSSSSSSG